MVKAFPVGIGLVVCFLFSEIFLYAQPVSAKSNPVFINFGMPEIVLDGEVFFNDNNSNNSLDASERVQFSFYIKNVGKYVANRVRVRTKVGNDINGIIVPDEIPLGNMAPDESRFIKRVIQGGPDLQSGTAEMHFEIIENDSLAKVITYNVETYSIIKKPRLEIIDHGFFSLDESSKTIQPDSPFELRVRLKNTGGGVAKNVRFDFGLPSHVLLNTLLKDKVIEKLDPGAVVTLSFQFYMGPNYDNNWIPIRIKVFDNNTDTGEEQTLNEPIRMEGTRN